MRVAVLFDTPYEGWTHDDHVKRMDEEIDAWTDDVEPEMEYQVADALRQKDHEFFLIGIHDDPQKALDFLRENPVDVVFNAAEAFKNDDRLDYLLPAMLEAEGIPYTGSPPMALMVTRNKAMSKKILSHHDVRVPSFRVYRVGEKVEADPGLGFPAIVKPLQKDASVGISQASIVRDVESLAERVAWIHERFNDAAIAEEFVDGRELYVSMFGNGDDVQILPAIELVFGKDSSKPEHKIATQSAKWDEPYRKRKGIKLVFARPLSEIAQQNIARACMTAYRALWLRDYARLDIRLAPDDTVWVLEANANPYLGVGHEIARSADKTGIDYDSFIVKICETALARYKS